MGGHERRPVATVLAELAEVRRHLRDAPPHHGAGVRDALARRQRSLEHELARARRGDEPDHRSPEDD